jgi:hypothetical protein
MLVDRETVLAGSYLRTAVSPPSFSPKERVAMNRVRRLKIGPVVLLVLLALLTLLTVHRRGVTAEEAQDEGVGAVVQLKDMVVRHEPAAVAFVALTALFAFVAWTALRANEGEDKATPPARESGASDNTAAG